MLENGPPYGPLRRSLRLKRLARPQGPDSQAVYLAHITAGGRRSHCPKIQNPIPCAVSRSEGAPSSSGISHPKQQKRSGTEHNLRSTKRRRISDSSVISSDDLRKVREGNPIDYWRRSGYFWPRKDWTKDRLTMDPAMSHLLARKKSTGSLRRNRSDSEFAEQSTITSSEQKSREAKSAPYRDVRYETLLATKGSFMDKDSLGVTKTSRTLIRQLLNQDQQVPQQSLFRDDIFEATCRKIRNKNETRVIRDISLLIVPSAEVLTTYGATELACLTESVNEGWSNSIPLTATRPQPDYAVGFRREAFTEEQLRKLQPFVGELTDRSFFMATFYLYFPFLTCEVKCGAAALDVADRQNAHSMTLALRAIVEMFRLAKREHELDHEILAFSVSHDHRSVRIYGHYPVIEETRTTFYRHVIREFNFTELEGRDKWTTYKFTKNVYCIWMPTHFSRLCSIIDTLPTDLSFELSRQSEYGFSGQTGLSQPLAAQNLSASIGASPLSTQGRNSR